MPGKGKGDTGSGGGGISISGNKRDNLLTGTDFNDVIFGGDGNDQLQGLGGNDLLAGENGDDTLFGDAGNDKLFGGQGDDLLYGGSDDDWLQGNSGSDLLDGGDGYDTVSFEEIGGNPGTGDGITLTTVVEGTTLGTSTYSVVNFDGSDTDTVVNTEEIIGSNYDDHMTGAGGDDYFVGALGEDTLIGNGGDDTLYGSLDDDVIYAGNGDGTGDAGADTLVFLRFADGKVATADAGEGDGNDVVWNYDPASDGIVILSNEEVVLVITDDGSDTLITYAGDSSILLKNVVVTDMGEAGLADDLNISIQVNADFEFIL